MGKLNAYKTDVKAETEGIWVDFDAGIQFKIARIGNEGFTKYVTEQSLKNRRFKRHRNADELSELTAAAMARYVLLDWKNIEDDNGNEMPYSVEKAYEILTDPEYRIVREFIESVAQDSEQYRQQLDEDTEKNSANTSAGT